MVLTDGVANVGLGSFGGRGADANEFYDKVGQFAE